MEENAKIIEEGEVVYIFDAQKSNADFKPFVVSHEEPNNDITQTRLLTRSGKRVRAIPEAWTEGFGSDYYRGRGNRHAGRRCDRPVYAEGSRAAECGF